MVMQSDPNVIVLYDGLVIGRIEAWADDPEIFDGWLEIEGRTDQLVINGSNRSWAEAEVARHYIGHALTETQEERDSLLRCEPGAWDKRETRLRRAREAGEISGAAIGRHLRSNGRA